MSNFGIKTLSPRVRARREVSNWVVCELRKLRMFPALAGFPKMTFTEVAGLSLHALMHACARFLSGSTVCRLPPEAPANPWPLLSILGAAKFARGAIFGRRVDSLDVQTPERVLRNPGAVSGENNPACLSKLVENQ